MLMRCAICLLTCPWLVGVTDAGAQSVGAVSADQVKAAFLYNFAGFVTWPAESAADKAIVIGVMGDEEVEAELRKNVDARPHPGRAVSVRSVASINDITGVHVLFLGPRQSYRLPLLVTALKQRPVLLVTEADDALDRGSMINFVTAERVQFEISMSAAARAGLQLSSRLLSVAMRIRKGEGAGFQPQMRAYLPIGRWKSSRQTRLALARFAPF
jgi:hypothetical protein